jgi:threonine/homoserine/homoserine lactone efflux protein
MRPHRLFQRIQSRLPLQENGPIEDPQEHAMDTPLFFKAMLIGFLIAAPVGPIGVLCMQRTLAHGARIGFVSGLGAALADGVYGALGAFGVAAVTRLFVSLATPLGLAGALFLALLGWRSLRQGGSAATGRDPARPGSARAFASVFALTLSNPMTILSFMAVFSALGASAPEAAAPATMVLGVVAGSALWWLCLASTVALLRQRIGAPVMRHINQAAGWLLIGFALWQLGTTLAG